MRLHWTYKGVDVFRDTPNDMGLRWIARPSFHPYLLRADTQTGMRELVNHYAPTR